MQQPEQQLKTDDLGRVEQEFEQLTVELRNYKPNTLEAWREHAPLNRYNDMLCFDQSRVVLKDGLMPNYIHANWIDGLRRKNAYILTQGPLNHTVVDFWRMIWQEDVATVVMVTRLEEKGRAKCARYFPTVNDMDFKAGFFKIELKKLEKRKLCFAALLAVTNTLCDETHYVVHVWYISWPDKGVPLDMDSLRHFLNYVKLININMSRTFYAKSNKHLRGMPIIYHCSAGVGRSAAIVALDVISEGFNHGVHTDVYELISKMRKQRFHAIHTKIQLLFIYDFVISMAAHQRIQMLQKNK